MKTQAARDLLRMARQLMADDATRDLPMLENTMAAVEKGVQSVRFSVDKYKSDPGKFAPQLENVAQLSHDVERMLQRLARVAGGLRKTAAPDAGHPMVSGSPEYRDVRKALETYELARNPDPRLRKLFNVLLSAMEAWENVQQKAARARRTPKL